MLFGTLFITSARLGFPLIVGASEPCSWGLFTTPLATHPLVAVLLPLNAFWSMQVTLTTFIVTFFLGKAYDFWRISYKLGRSIQGRLQDINLMLATHCFRDAQGEYTPDSRSILEDTARHVRLLHGLFWAGIDDSLSSIRTQVTPNGHRTAAEGVVIAIGLPSDHLRITFGSPSDHHRIAFGLPSDCVWIAFGLRLDCV